MVESAESDLARANAAFYAAFESLDLERMSALWARTVKVSCVHPGWEPTVGAREVIESWREIFGATTTMRIEVDAAQVTVVGEAGWVVCREVVHTNVQGQPVENALSAFNAFIREDGEWRICHHHASPRLAGRPAPKPGPPQTLH